MDSTDAGRPLAGTELGWFRAVPGGTGVVVLAVLLSRPFPLSALPPLRHHLTFSPAGLPSLSLSQNPSPQIPTASAPDFLSVVDLQINANPWADRSSHDPVPLSFATLYDLPDGRSVLAIRAHNLAFDRTSTAAVLRRILGRIGGEGAEREDRIHLGMEDLIPKDHAWKPFWARGKDLIGYSVNGFRNSCLGFVDTSSDRRTEMVRMVLSRDETRGLLKECEKRGIKLCSAMAAAAMIAAHSSKKFEYNQRETYSIVTLIDCRESLEPKLDEDDIGFYHSAVINTHGIEDGEDLWDVSSRCHKSYFTAKSNKKHLKDIGELNFLMGKAIDNPQLTPSSSMRTALISVFEETQTFGSSDMLHELGIDDFIACSSVHGVGPSIAVFDTIRDGKLDCALVYPSPVHSREQITELVEHIKKLLIENSRASEHFGS